MNERQFEILIELLGEIRNNIIDVEDKIQTLINLQTKPETFAEET